MDKRASEPFIFYLILEEDLPKHFYTFNQFFKELGFILLPVRVDQLQTLIASSDQEQMIVLSSVSDSKEYKLFNEKVRGLLKFLLKSRRLTYMQLSSFSKLNDFKLYSLQKNYYFFKYPLNAKALSAKIVQYHDLKTDQSSIWPGGRRASLKETVS